MTFGRLLQLFVLVPLCGALAVPITLRVYWGYWWSPPGIESLTDQMASLDRFTSFYDEYPFQPEPAERRGSVALHRGADEGDGILRATAELGTDRPGRLIGIGCSPMPSLCHAFVLRKLEPISDDVIPESRVDDMLRLLDAGGYFDAKDRGGPMLAPIAHLAEGRRADGSPLTIAAFSSSQLSNDHYAYCEALFDTGPNGELRLVEANQFRFDSSGMEEIMHWFVGGTVTAILLMAWLMCAFTLALRAAVLWLIRVSPRSRSAGV